MSVVPFPGLEPWPTPDELSSNVGARERVREELRHFVLLLARVICPQCAERDVPTLGGLANWWADASDRSRGAADEALVALFGPGWSWRVAEHTIFEPDEPVFVAVPPPTRRGAPRNRVLSLVDVQREFEVAGLPYEEHPMIPIVRAWLYERAIPGVAFRPKTVASLPRLHLGATGEPTSGMFLTDASPPGRRSLELPFGGDEPEFEIVDSSPSWLLEMFAACARAGRGGATCLPWSFRLAIGGLVNLDTHDRDGRMRTLEFEVEELIQWLELARSGRWAHRARDYPRLRAALEETPRYRVTLAGQPYWLVSGGGLPDRFERAAPCWITVRTPPGAKGGMRIDWRRFCGEARSAVRGRGYLSLQALLDRSARNGRPLTRLIRSPSISPETGKPVRTPDGGFVRAGPLVPNPAARYAPFLPECDVAAFLGLSSSAKNKYDAIAAVKCKRYGSPTYHIYIEWSSMTLSTRRVSRCRISNEGTRPSGIGRVTRPMRRGRTPRSPPSSRRRGAGAPSRKRRSCARASGPGTG